MAEESEVWIRLQADINDIKSKLGELQSSSQTTATTMQSQWTTTAKQIGTALGAAFGIAGALVAVKKTIDFLKESTSAFAEEQVSVNKLNATLANLGIPEEGIASIEKTVDSLRDIAHFDDTEIREAFSTLLVRFEDTKTAALGLQAAMQVARFQNTDLASAVQTVGTAAMGATRSLKQFGITTADGKSQTELLNEIIKNTKAGFDSYYGTLKDGNEAMKISFSELKEKIGEAMSDSLTSVSYFATGFLNSITDAMQNTDDFKTSIDDLEQSGHDLARVGLMIGEAFSLVGNVLASATFALTHFWSALKGDTSISTAINENWDAWKKHWDELWASYNNWSPKTMKDIEKATRDIGDAAGDAGKKSEEAANQAAAAWRAAWSPISIIGGNVPELAKFVGNLTMMKPITRKTQIEVTINVRDTSQTPTKTSQAVLSTLAKRLKDEIAYESHGTPTIGGF